MLCHSTYTQKLIQGWLRPTIDIRDSPRPIQVMLDAADRTQGRVTNESDIPPQMVGSNGCSADKRFRERHQ